MKIKYPFTPNRQKLGSTPAMIRLLHSISRKQLHPLQSRDHKWALVPLCISSNGQSTNSNIHSLPISVFYNFCHHYFFYSLVATTCCASIHLSPIENYQFHKTKAYPVQTRDQMPMPWQYHHNALPDRQ